VCLKWLGFSLERKRLDRGDLDRATGELQRLLSN
jgi:hypothetical protein